VTAPVLHGCATGVPLARNDADVVLAHQLLDAPHPGRPGAYRVASMFYGSGSDRRRPEFRDSVSIRTEPVDASKLISLGDQADERNGYWGFSPKDFPLNGRVWYPVGEGPFPLVLVVHGNHNPRDFSDPGYQYLGELLASRGFIVTSIDMNFVNGGIRQENDARGWLLLKHVEAWKQFHEDRSNAFFGKIDLNNVALIGHSRGGEAVGHAAAFNRLEYYPDDASVRFDFNFGIQSIIAIAPVDGQYLPTGRQVPVENVNYLVFHGSHDGDVTSFHGLRLYNRVRFTDDVPRFKAAVYVYRANHGQWNTVWGSHDNGPRSGRRLDLGVLIDAEDQREFGKIYISSFLEATLRRDKRYLPIFRDHRVIGGWLPKTMYVTRFEASSFRPLATFEEDIDVTTGTEDGVWLHADSMATWRENRLALRSRNRTTTSGSQDNQALWLGWNNRIAGEDTTQRGTPAVFRIVLPDSLPRSWALDRNSSLDLLLAATDATPGPRRAAKDSANGDDERPERGGRRRPSGAKDEEKPPIDLTVQLIDVDGDTAGVLLSRYGPIRRPLGISIMRRKDLEPSRFGTTYELVQQAYSILLGDFVRANADVRLPTIREIRFVFDQTDAGTVVVDNIGFSQLDPAFARVSAAGR
jgi:dienelactone hydrolase